MQYALGPAIGLAAVALARGRGRTLPRGGWLAAGVLAGAWATFLGGGYVSNLVFAAAFIAAAAALARRTRRGTIAAALLLAGGAITHPGFFVVGATVLAVAGTWAWMHEGRFGWNTDAGRVATALLGSGALAAAGLVAATLGGARIAGETSTDAFLRATGQLHTLRRSYLDRFLVNWRRYSPFMTVALATAGAFRAHGFARRLLLSWAGVSAVGLALGAATGWYPPDRILMFAFCLPMLAAFGLVALGEWLGRWWLAWPVGLLLTTLIVAPAVRDWRDQFPYISPDEVAHLTLAGRIAADRSQAGHAAGVRRRFPRHARGAVPADAHRERRARGAARRIGRATSTSSSAPRRTCSPGSRARTAIRATTSRRRPRSIGSPADRTSRSWSVRTSAIPPSSTRPGSPDGTRGSRAARGAPQALAPNDDELAPVEPRKILEATWRTFLLLIVLGLGWAWWALGDVASGVAGSAAFGAPMLALTSFALERLGAPLGSIGTSTLACALAGGCGYALLAARLLGQRRRRLLDADVVLEERPVVDP